MRKVYRDFGIDLTRFNGDDSWRLPMPARFVADGGGVVRSAEVHPDYTARPEPESVLDALEGLV
jgi:peroxiredoxin